MVANRPSILWNQLRSRSLRSRALLDIAVLMMLVAGAAWPADDLSDPGLVFPVRDADFKPWRQQLHRYTIQTMGDVFRKNYDHQQPWAASAEQALDDAAVYLADLPEAKSSQAIRAEAAAVIASGCDDPMVLYACSLGFLTMQQIDKAIEALVKAKERFKGTAYPACRLQRIIGRLLICRIMREGKNLSPETEGIIGEWIAVCVKTMLEAGSGDFVGRQLHAKELGEGKDGNDEMRERLHVALIAEIDKGGVDPWFGDMVKGYAEIDRAWAARGNGLGHSVTEAGWKGFAEHLDIAEKSFSAAWVLDPTLPQAAAEMIAVCKGKGSGFEAEKMWMNRALSAHMDCMDAYANLIGAWHPSWGGNYEAILAIGRQALATRAFDTDVPEVLLRTFNRVAVERQAATNDPNIFWPNPQVWSDIKALFDGNLAEPSREAVRDWDLTRYAAYAWRCGKADQANLILKRIKGHPDAATFREIAHESLDSVQKASKGASDF